MRLLRRSLSVLLTLCFGVAGLAVIAPAAQAATGPVIRITEVSYGGKITGQSGDGEYVEITNVGDAAQNLSGWTFAAADPSPAQASGISMTGLGTLAPGASAIVTDVTAASFRTEWGLKSTVQVLANTSGTNNLNSGPRTINIYNSDNTLVESARYVAGDLSAKGVSKWVDAAHLGAGASNGMTGWTVSAVGDAEGSWTNAAATATGSPGASKRGTSTPASVRAVAALRITEYAYGGKIAGANGGDGEYTEITNVGGAAQSLTGWTFATGATTPTAGSLDLSSLGSIAAGASVLVTDVSATEFRNDWGLKTSVAIIDNGKTNTLNSGPRTAAIFNGSTLVDAASYASGYFTGGKGQATFVDAAHLGAGASNGTTGWTFATTTDTESSWTSGTGSVGSPGASTRGTLTPTDVRTGTTGGGGSEAPCDTEVAAGSGPAPAAATTWPGGTTPATIDDQCAWVTSQSGQDLSGLAFDPNNANVLYAVKNKNHVYRLLRAGGTWVKDTANGWASGKDIKFPAGQANSNAGLPDSEGLTVGPDGMLYITTERDNAAKSVPLDSILKFDPTSSDTTLVASDQWILTTDVGFPPTDADDSNLGFEGVAFVPDSFLTASGFKTDAGTAYDPASYPDKAVSGLLFGAVEKTGHLLAYVLNTNHTFTRVADVDTGLAGVMDAQYDADLGRIWAHCDNTCGNATTLLKIGADGHFALDRTYSTPTGLPNYNLEGFAVAPLSTAINGTREVLWADDGNRFGHSLWSGTVNVALGLAQTRTPDPVINGTSAVGGTLTATVGSWDPGVTTHYVWKDGDTVLATDQALTLTPALSGKTVTLATTGTRTGFAPATRTASTTVAAGTLTTAKPTITGTAQVGQTLSAHSDDWGPGTVALSYAWFADDVAISGETGDSLLLKPAQVGTKITVKVTGARDGYTSQTVASDPTDAVAPGALTTATPTITGTAQVGQTLTAHSDAWGPGTVGLSYAWFAGADAISGATGDSLVLAPEQVGENITVKVTGARGGYASQTVASEPTNVVAPGALTTATPTITGTAQVGQTLTAHSDAWGPGTVGLSYAWFAGTDAISGATGDSLVVAPEQVGKDITVKVTGARGGYASQTVASEPTNVVAPGALTTATPTITGTATVGQTLTAHSDAWGPGTVGLSYAWFAGADAISGATGDSIVLAPAQLGKTITVKVTGARGGYISQTIASEPTSAVAAGTLTTKTPTITGTATVGQTLTAHSDAWGPGVVGLTYAWFADGAAISGATADSLVLAPAQAGKKITVKATGAKDGYTSQTVSSDPTAAVANGALITKTPIVSGTPQVGQILTASSDPWGPGTVALSYSWLANGSPFAHGPSARLGAAQIGTTVTVQVTGTEPGYVTQTVSSAATGAVQPGVLSASAPDLVGKAKVGRRLTVEPGAWTAGGAPVTLTYTWYDDGKVIRGHAGPTLKLKPTYRHDRIKVVVTGTAAGYTTVSLTSPVRKVR